MRIGIAGPMTLDLFRPYLPASAGLPQGYPFPMTAALVCELLERGHQVTAFTTSTDITEPYYVSKAPFTLCVIPSAPRHRARNLFRQEIAGLKQAFATHPCDILHAFWTYEFATAALSSGVPTLITLEDWARAIFFMHQDLYRLVRWGMNAYVVRRARNLSVISPYLLDAVPASAKAKTAVIPNFIQDHIAERALPSTNREPYIISVCNGFSKRKNLGNALLGFQRVRAAFGSVRYLLVGNDCQPGGLAEKFCREHGCGDNVEFVGPVSYDRVLELIGRAVFMLHPALEESFGMSVIEAMALNTPVIAGDRSGNMPHLLQHCKTGYLCNVEEPAGIEQALNALLSNEELRGRIATAAHQYVQENFSSSVVVDQFLDTYRRILAGETVAAEACLCN